MMCSKSARSKSRVDTTLRPAKETLHAFRRAKEATRVSPMSRCRLRARRERDCTRSGAALREGTRPHLPAPAERHTTPEDRRANMPTAYRSTREGKRAKANRSRGFAKICRDRARQEARRGQVHVLGMAEGLHRTARPAHPSDPIFRPYLPCNDPILCPIPPDGSPLRCGRVRHGTDGSAARVVRDAAALFPDAVQPCDARHEGPPRGGTAAYPPRCRHRGVVGAWLP